MALWVMVLSRFSAPLITLAPAPPPTCLFIPMTYSFKCNTDNFDKVRCNLLRIESEHKVGRERQWFLETTQQQSNKNESNEKGSDAIGLAMLRNCWLNYLEFFLCICTSSSQSRRHCGFGCPFVCQSHSCKHDILIPLNQVPFKSSLNVRFDSGQTWM